MEKCQPPLASPAGPELPFQHGGNATPQEGLLLPPCRALISPGRSRGLCAGRKGSGQCPGRLQAALLLLAPSWSLLPFLLAKLPGRKLPCWVWQPLQLARLGVARAKRLSTSSLRIHVGSTQALGSHRALPAEQEHIWAEGCCKQRAVGVLGRCPHVCPLSVWLERARKGTQHWHGSAPQLCWDAGQAGEAESTWGSWSSCRRDPWAAANASVAARKEGVFLEAEGAPLKQKGLCHPPWPRAKAARLLPVWADSTRAQTWHPSLSSSRHGAALESCRHEFVLQDGLQEPIRSTETSRSSAGARGSSCARHTAAGAQRPGCGPAAEQQKLPVEQSACLPRPRELFPSPV